MKHNSARAANTINGFPIRKIGKGYKHNGENNILKLNRGGGAMQLNGLLKVTSVSGSMLEIKPATTEVTLCI
jgi:hypothetical protein